jgi:hypothetical protein
MGSRQKGKGNKRKRSWHRRGPGPDWAFQNAMKKLTRAGIGEGTEPAPSFKPAPHSR